MAKRSIIVTGVPEVTRALNSLRSNRARAVHRQAMRKAAKVVLDWAKNIAPVVSGEYRRSLTVRALARSRRFAGVRVTQRTGAFRGNTFYGGFLEFGWRTGKRRGNRDAPVTRRKVPGRWLLRKAGTFKEDEARGIYIAEVRQLIDREMAK